MGWSIEDAAGVRQRVLEYKRKHPKATRIVLHEDDVAPLVASVMIDMQQLTLQLMSSADTMVVHGLTVATAAEPEGINAQDWMNRLTSKDA
jgi:hypothetical protein